VPCATGDQKYGSFRDAIDIANGRLTAAEALGHRELVMTKLYRSA
jgi:altronate dehydratase